MTNEEIKSELTMIQKGFTYVDSKSEPEVTAFMPRLLDKMRTVCLMVQQLERSTGLKYDWDKQELIEPQQITF